MSYKHDALIRAWLSGTPIEYMQNGQWQPLPSPDEASKLPHFYPECRYREKPFTVRFRIARIDDKAVLVQSLLDERLAERCAGFRGWLTEWAEVQQP